MIRLLALLSVILFLSSSLSAQKDTATIQRNKLTAYPVLFYLPETSLGFGGVGAYTFRLPTESNETRPSQFSALLAYTLQKQVLVYLYNEIYQDDQKWWLRNEIGYYIYFYDFFGVGNDNLEDYVETFGVTYPRIRLNAQRLMLPNFYTGIRYWYDGYNITQTEEEGLLRSGEITGGLGGTVSGIGWVNNYDSRDNIFTPRSGWFVEVIGFWNRKGLGSDFNFSRYTYDVATYFKHMERNVFAVNLFGGFITGDAPFNELMFLGGSRKGRGYYEGRFRDNHLVLLQGEYRMQVFKRIGMTFFGSYGAVAPKFNAYELENFRWNAGLGLRYLANPQEGLTARVDFGFGKNAFNFYFTVGEAF
ncbi:MAG: BamA/TamA family outer membrane protein [Bacteroidota bacterium]